MDKRTFIKSSLGCLAATAVSSFENLIIENENAVLADITQDEAFWRAIRKGYKLKSDYINLENGYYCFVPEYTLQKFMGHVKEINFQGSYYMRNQKEKAKENILETLAHLLGCSAEEIAITRNTTESLDTVINGYNWQSGDEAVMALQDYGSIINQFKLMENRYGIKTTIVSVPNHPKNDEEIVQLYANAITAKTRLLMVSHIVNITGQILPIKKICDMAHAKGVDVMVDGAHAIGHFEFNITDLNCDYYGSSLHKWLSVPLGAGLLYVKKDKIKDLYPLMAPWNNDALSIKKLAHTGTHPSHTDHAILDAIVYYNRLGKDRKEARLRFLQRYWSDKVRDIPRIVLNTPQDLHRSCAIANVGIEGVKPSDLAKTLLDKYKIFTVAIDGQNVHGCRITPNVYTNLNELDQFVDALQKIAKS